MKEEVLTTSFAPAERSGSEEIAKQVGTIEKNRLLLGSLLDSLLDIVMILNDKRQVIYANKALLKVLNISDSSCLHGKRPGEALNCIRASENRAGCGTTEFCSECGAVQAILSGISGKKDARECRIIQQGNGDALDLLVSTSPLELDGERYVVCSVADISNEKRRKALERIFFHDVLNTAGTVWGFAGLIQGMEPEKARDFFGHIHSASAMLIDEIKAQRELLAAESNELRKTLREINSLEFLEGIVNSYRGHEISAGRFIETAADSDSVNLTTDPVLLGRVIANMLKNALEASREGETVTLRSRLAGEEVEFSVNNAAVMPREAQLQVFQRSFSTKGTNRGLGTYSIRLLSERYLGGHVSFKSAEGEGTTFFARYPLKLAS